LSADIDGDNPPVPETVAVIAVVDIGWSSVPGVGVVSVPGSSTEPATVVLIGVIAMGVKSGTFIVSGSEGVGDPGRHPVIPIINTSVNPSQRPNMPLPGYGRMPHNLKLPSKEPEARYSPSGEKAS